MNTRQDHIDFARNYCRHYAPKPGSGDYCALSCGSFEMMKKARASGAAPMMPCIGGHACTDVQSICPKWERQTMEHAEARADSIEASMKRMAIVGPVVAEWRKKEPRGKYEVIECPACKGRLHLNQSAFNGHVRGRCSTPGCVTWVE